MRKALLVATLIAASFAGGAAVNGPGLKWAKGLIVGKMRRGDAIPTLEVDGDGPPRAQDDAPQAAPAPPPASDVPSAPPPSLADRVLRAATPTSPRPVEPEPAPKPEAAPAAPISDPPASPAPTDDPEAPPPLTSPSDPPAAPGPGLLPARGRDAGWADAPSPAPATAVLPRPKGLTPQARTDDPQAMPASTSSPAPNSPPWADLRRRMRAMGVTRYWVEGAPSGSVTFRCVVPVPGEDSAGRQFEAEADDEARAAESALRRVALWQATQRVKN